MKLLFLGAGATAGYFGGRLAAAGVDVAFLVRPARAARLRDEPLRIESPLGDVSVPVKAVAIDDLGVGADYDLVVLSCKAYDLDEAIATIRPAVGRQTCVLPVLNGLAHLDRLDGVFGAERVLGGLCQIAAMLAEDGVVRHLNRTHQLVFGARLAEQEAFCEALTPHGEAIINETLAECAAVATATGAAPREQTMDHIHGVLTEPGSTFAASMLRDIEAGKRIEADHIIGDLIGRAGALGVATPRLQTSYCHLKAYENRRAREAA